MFDILKQNINLTRHIEKFTSLRQSGRTHHGLCPLHPDKESPSLYVYSQDNSWWCFGCNRGGDLIDFEALRQNISMGDAAKLLCEEYNLHPSPMESIKFQQTLALRRKKTEWLDSLTGSFNKRPDIYEYVKKRGLSEETLKEFHVGAGENSNVVVIPINDKFGRIAGFARRLINPGPKDPKYVNDSSDSIYDKSEILYNFDKAKHYIKEKKAIVLNEGYFDTMTLWEADIKHSVAFCSSRITKDQMKSIVDIVDEDYKVYLVPTNDETAQNELVKNIAIVKLHLPKNHIRVLVIPEGCKDLNDVLIQGDKEVVADIYDASIPVELYLVKRIIRIEPQQEAQYQKVKNLCDGIDNAMILADIGDYLAGVWKKPPEIIKSYLLARSESSSVDISKFKTIDTLINDYDLYVEKLKENRINFGWVKTDLVTRGMRMGDVVTLVAASNVGKTMMAQNLILNLAKQYPDMPQIFFSLEQIGVMAFERFVMMEGQMESHQVEGWHKNQDVLLQDKLMETLKSLGKSFKNFVLVDEGDMTTKKIENYAIQAGMKMFNKPVKVIVVDYLGYIKGEGQDMYHRISEIAREMKQLAKRLNCVVVLLCQVSKAGKSGGDPIEGYHARDSGVVMESADILFSAWRPELKEDLKESERKDLEGIYMVRVAKNRYGPSGVKIEFMFVKRYLKLLEKRDEILTVDKDGKIVGK